MQSKGAEDAMRWCAVSTRMILVTLLLGLAACSVPPPVKGPNATWVGRSLMRVDSGQDYDTPPEITSMRTPVYPQVALEHKVSGVVWVRVRVLEEGRVANLVTVESGPEELQQSAVDAVRSALFLPAMLQGRPVAVWASIPIEYSLNP